MSPWISVALDIPVNKSFLYKNNPDSPARIGVRVEVEFRNRKKTAYVIAEFDSFDRAAESLLDKRPRESDILSIIKTIDDEPLFGEELIALSRWMAEYYLCAQGEALAAMLPSGKKESAGASFTFEESFPENRYELSDEQRSALNGILSGGGVFNYLYGVTGSGKTEVFLQAAAEVISRGESVIYLVPEIALTHQIIEAARVRFGSSVAVVHSGLTPSRRLSEWKRIVRGEAKLAIGARSAVFAPVQSLGMIIIDEEHDASYKSGNSPRYHARQIAMKRCKNLGAALIMGSATPSAEAWRLMNNGAIRRFRLTRNLAGGARPAINVVRMSAGSGVLSGELVEAVRQAKADGRQSILFLNRRGFSRFFQCKVCGETFKCKNCSVSMTYYKSKKRMICHYCGWSAPPPVECPECGSLEIGAGGFGTEYVEEEIARAFAGYTIRRLDADSVSRKGEAEKIISDFKKGEIDILLGTQMIAKGLNFPGVRVVGVVSADTGLYLPDFRAAERTFALLVQVAGRAGRFFPDGTVVVQTYAPDVPAIALACSGSVDEFYEQELRQRETLGFPPFSRLIRIVFRSKNPQAAARAAEDAEAFLNDLLSRLAFENTALLGPSDCPLAVLAGNARIQIILRAPKLKYAHILCAEFLRQYSPQRGVYIETDVDPVSLL